MNGRAFRLIGVLGGLFSSALAGYVVVVVAAAMGP